MHKYPNAQQGDQVSKTNNLTDMTVNVGDNERVVSSLAGAGLVSMGLRQGGFAGAVLSLIGGGLLFRGVTGHCHLYGALERSTAVPSDRRIHVKKSVTINKSQAELYQFWRNLENLPQFMRHLESVVVLDEKNSHWRAKAPLGYSVEWDAEISSDVENEHLGWHSKDGSEIANSGMVEFKPTANRGTEVVVTLTYEPPAGKIGALFARLFGEEPNQQVEDDLRRFKQLMETGVIMETEGQPSGRDTQSRRARA